MKGKHITTYAAVTLVIFLLIQWTGQRKVGAIFLCTAYLAAPMYHVYLGLRNRRIKVWKLFGTPTIVPRDKHPFVYWFLTIFYSGVGVVFAYVIYTMV